MLKFWNTFSTQNTERNTECHNIEYSILNPENTTTFRQFRKTFRSVFFRSSAVFSFNFQLADSSERLSSVFSFNFELSDSFGRLSSVFSFNFELSDSSGRLSEACFSLRLSTFSEPVLLLRRVHWKRPQRV